MLSDKRWRFVEPMIGPRSQTEREARVALCAGDWMVQLLEESSGDVLWILFDVAGEDDRLGRHTGFGQ